jgi:hypothetical protein
MPKYGPHQSPRPKFAKVGRIRVHHDHSWSILTPIWSPHSSIAVISDYFDVFECRCRIWLFVPLMLILHCTSICTESITCLSESSRSVPTSFYERSFDKTMMSWLHHSQMGLTNMTTNTRNRTTINPSGISRAPLKTVNMVNEGKPTVLRLPFLGGGLIERSWIDCVN